MLKGGCYCGHVRFEAHGEPFNATICHRVDCRRVAGAPMVAWFTVRSDGLIFTAGQPTVFRSSEKGSRSFCPKCGTTLTFRSSDTPEEIDVATCSLDDPEQVPPRDHTMAKDRLAWIHMADGLKAYETTRP